VTLPQRSILLRLAQSRSVWLGLLLDLGVVAIDSTLNWQMGTSPEPNTFAARAVFARLRYTYRQAAFIAVMFFDMILIVTCIKSLIGKLCWALSGNPELAPLTADTVESQSESSPTASPANEFLVEFAAGGLYWVLRDVKFESDKQSEEIVALEMVVEKPLEEKSL